MYIKSLILDQIGNEAYNYISKIVNLDDDTAILKTHDKFNIEVLKNEEKHNIINLAKLNDVSSLNEFFFVVNQKLKNNGVFICFFESNFERNKRLQRKYPIGFNYIYIFLDYIFKSTFLNFYITRKINFFITAGRNKRLHKAEILGRLVFNGFEIINNVEIDNVEYAVCKKVSHPKPISARPRNGLLFKMTRTGYRGTPIEVYKIRTMYRYAEYIQEYIYKLNNLQEGGKIKNDFRITPWGKFLRAVWLDEIPMIYNLLNGDVKLVGVRPISPHYLSLYTKELQDKRMQFKPGLIPPFYADLPKSLIEIMDSELRYLNLYQITPIKTDLVYLKMALKNMILNKAHSN